jgi:hypothetical protein
LRGSTPHRGGSAVVVLVVAVVAGIALVVVVVVVGDSVLVVVFLPVGGAVAVGVCGAAGKGGAGQQCRVQDGADDGGESDRGVLSDSSGALGSGCVFGGRVGTESRWVRCPRTSGRSW